MSLDSVPIWVLFIRSFLLVMISIEAGNGLGHVANWRKIDEKESPTSAVAAAILGLVALMLASRSTSPQTASTSGRSS